MPRKKKDDARTPAPHEKPPSIQEQIDALMAAGWAAFEAAQAQATKLKPMAALEFYRRALDIASELEKREMGDDAHRGNRLSAIINGWDPAKLELGTRGEG